MNLILNSDWLNPNFNSIGFLLMFSLVYLAYVLWGQKVQARNFLLLGFSLLFYYLLSGKFILLLGAMAYSDFIIGKKIISAPEKNKIHWRNLSIVINISVLATFKYFWFFAGTWYDLNHEDWSQPESWIIPVGISFFIFKSLSYTLDIFQENIEEAESSFADYLLYVSFFPNILAGPISLARDFLPQLKTHRIPGNTETGTGLFLIICGMLKKYALADYIAVNLVDRVFENPHLFTGLEHLMAAYGYTFQLYLDFSGYSEMMMGGAMLFGITLMPNFNQPFIADNISHFWRRWHISLSRWFQEFVFIPLNFSWRSLGRHAAVLAVITTFLLSGLWHGAAWTFVIWGLLHGLAIAWDSVSLNFRLKMKSMLGEKCWTVISILLTFHFVVFTVILFKSENTDIALEMYRGIFTRFNSGIFSYWMEGYHKPFMIILLAAILHYIPESWTNIVQTQFIKLAWPAKAIIITGSIILVFQTLSADQVPFQYLEF